MINFNLFCPTYFGQNLFLVIGNKEYSMSYLRDGMWICDVDIESNSVVEYSYLLKNPDGTIVSEGLKKRFLPYFATNNGVVNDEFIYRDISTIFESKPFVNCLAKHVDYLPFPAINENDILLIVDAPLIEKNQGVAIVGEGDFLGNWQVDKKLIMYPSYNNLWWINLPYNHFLTHAEYKFVVYDKYSGEILKWEIGNNRRMPLIIPNAVYTKHINVDYNWHGSGVAIPVFSLRSSSDWGVGEFYDLIPFADWAKKNGHSLIQILPINDTTSTNTDLDSYPYKANSVYALHPMYLNIDAVGKLKNSAKYKEYINKAKKLNKLNSVDYSQVNKLKLSYLREYFDENYSSIISDTEFCDFISNNNLWLKDYAVFSVLRNEFGTDDFTTWGQYALYNKSLVDEFYENNLSLVYFYCFIQYHLDKQLSFVIQQLHQKGIVIKGDLPIGISRYSVDAWVYPKYFNLGMQAGAPPDDFSITGQNWGFPTYNWKEISKDNFQWWKNRFNVMERYFDAFRIDHILGFFRIWEISKENIWGLLGHFSPAKPMSVNEIENYGLHFDYDRFVSPFITKELLYNILGDDFDEIVPNVFNQKTYNLYSFKPEYDTQRKLFDNFNNNTLNKKYNILEKLLPLYAEVLFIQDEYEKGNYHPRINLMNSYSFSQLDDNVKWCLTRIHDEFFYHRHTSMWADEAMKKLPVLIDSTNMLVCGEDLGMVPDCVPGVMRKLQILSLEVERMPKEVNKKFVDLNQVPYLSVCCTGTHDTSTLRQWWKEDKANTQWYFNNILHKIGNAPDDLTADLAKNIINNHLNSKSMWAILPWQDYMACDDVLRSKNIDERINVPSNPKHIWNWRMHLDVNKLN